MEKIYNMSIYIDSFLALKVEKFEKTFQNLRSERIIY